MKIRFARQSDMKACRRLDKELRPSQMVVKIKAKDVVVATSEGSVVGYLRVEWFWLKIPYLTWIYVEPNFRNSGVAGSLLTFLKKQLKKKRKKTLLSSYQDNALNAKRWHARSGFRKCGKISSINEDKSNEVFCLLRL